MPQANRFLVIVAVGALALAGCGRREAPPRPQPPAPAVKLPDAAPVSAADYVKRESSRALLVVRASELAKRRSANGRIHGIADRLMRDHNGIAAQLSMAGRRLNLLPSATLLPADQVQLDGLSRSSDFEDAYLRTMTNAVEDCRNGHASYADKGDSPTLRPVARFAASTCLEELRLL